MNNISKKSVIDTIDATIKQGVKEKKKATILYDKLTMMPFNTSRPDIALLVELVAFAVFIIIGFKVLPFITPVKNPGFTEDEYKKASDKPTTEFSISELANVQLEIKSMEDFQKHFEFKPHSPDNMGLIELIKSCVIIPVLGFIIIFIVPPFICAYILWFIITYWPYVFAAVIGWIKMLYSYFTDLLQGNFGCKWYIKMATGWGCYDVNFMDYFNQWKSVYIDQPVYYERLKYIRKYLWVKRMYYEIPYRKYIVLPTHKYKTKLEYAKKLYINRAFEVLLKKLLFVNKYVYEMPRDYVLDNLRHKEKKAAALFGKIQQTKSQINGKKYMAVDKDGKQCMCPAKIGPLSKLKKIVDTDILKVVDKVNKIHDRYNNDESEGFTSMNMNNDNNTSSYLMYLFLALLLLFIIGNLTLKNFTKYCYHNIIIIYGAIFLSVLFIL